MKTNVYNVIWADDQIDTLLDEIALMNLDKEQINVICRAHNAQELEEALTVNRNKVDAVIVDANFNETANDVGSDRDTSGLDYARFLYKNTLEKKIPFFLFTGRTDDMLWEKYKDNPSVLQEDFPRHQRWFNKSGEFRQMLEKIREVVNEYQSPEFVVRNRYRYELNSATLIDGAYDFLFEYLLHEYNGTLEEIHEPFISVRRTIEKMFTLCENMSIIPPISSDTNGTAAYFFHHSYRPADKELYRMSEPYENIMKKPLASALRFIVNIVQDGAHSKKGLTLDVDKYYLDTKDTFLLKSVVCILMDLVQWFALTALAIHEKKMNPDVFWENTEE